MLSDADLKKLQENEEIGGPEGIRVGQLFINYRDTGSPTLEEIKRQFVELPDADQVRAWQIGIHACRDSLPVAIEIHRVFHGYILRAHGVDYNDKK